MTTKNQVQDERIRILEKKLIKLEVMLWALIGMTGIKFGGDFIILISRVFI